MIKRLLAVCVLALATAACAPALHRASSATCLDVATHQGFACPTAEPRYDVQQQQEPQEKKTPPQGPGKKDFGVWMVLLTMGFGALYLMAFK